MFTLVSADGLVILPFNDINYFFVVTNLEWLNIGSVLGIQRSNSKLIESFIKSFFNVN